MKKDILILIFLSAIIFLSALGSGSLSSWDEAFYAQVSREMFERGDWLHLYWGGASWNDKPPMYMWVTCVFYELFGVNEFSARLFSALSGTALVVFTYLLGLRFFGRRTGFIAAVMMMSSYHFILFAKSGTLDVASAMFITGAIYFLGRDKEAGWHTVTAFMLFSLAFLTKSFAALLVPVIFTGYVAITGKWRLIFNRYAFVGAVISFLTLGLWHYSAFSSDGNFVGGYFIQHLFQRTTQAMDGHTGNWLTYINVVLYKAKPWGSVGIVALLFFVISSIKKKETEKWLFIVWIVATYAIFTAVKTKLHWYIIPVYPAIFLVAAWGMEKLLRKFSLIVVLVISIGSVLYFGAKKEIFSLDFNHDIKKFASEIDRATGAERVSGGIYAVDVSDPGLMFYMSGIAKRVSPDNYKNITLGKKNFIAVGRNETLAALKIQGKRILSCRNDYSAVLVE